MGQQKLQNALSMYGKVVLVRKGKFPEKHVYPVRSGVVRAKLQLTKYISSFIVCFAHLQDSQFADVCPQRKSPRVPHGPNVGKATTLNRLTFNFSTMETADIASFSQLTLVP